MLSSSKDILVNANSCLNFPCNKSCSSLECELCLSCLTQVPVALNHLHRSYREQMRCGGNMKRIFPKHYDDSLVNQLSPSNRLSTKWFQAKCDAEGGVWCWFHDAMMLSKSCVRLLIQYFQFSSETLSFNHKGISVHDASSTSMLMDQKRKSFSHRNFLCKFYW